MITLLTPLIHADLSTFLCQTSPIFTKQHHTLPCVPLPESFLAMDQPSIQHSFLILTLFGRRFTREERILDKGGRLRISLGREVKG